ncbi:AAA family ATPase [Yinghuangia sp. YIM S10712]|uniref:AAA family ATPase n=1 Tax=Yinghuangia sp. YIM S10712 TaxID=3436930 RepID=UPI003F534F7F
MNESGDVGMDGDKQSGGGEGTERSEAPAGRQPGGRPTDALAAARAALAALDKANAANGSETSSRDELAAAWQALAALGGAHGTGPGASSGRSAAPRSRGREGADWALPVVDAPPSRFDTPDEPDTPVRPGTRDEWAVPVLDAPVTGRAEARPSHGPSGPPEAPPSQAASSGPAEAAPRESRRPPLAGDPDAAWAAPVLDAPPPAPEPGPATDDSLFEVRRPAAPRGAAETGFPTSAHRDDASGRAPDESELAAVREALAAGGAPVRLADQALVALGPDAAALLREDPWNLLALPGISPQQADLFARTASAGGTPDPDDARRTRALIAWHLLRAANQGHTAVGAVSAVFALEQLGVRDALGALRAAYEHGRVMAFAELPAGDGTDADPDAEADETADEFDDGFGHPFDGPADRVLIALERHALAEESIAEAVLRLMSTATPSAADASPLDRALRGSGVVLHMPGAGEDPPRAPLELARAAGPRATVVCPTLDGALRVREFLTADESGPAVLTLHALFAERGGAGRGGDGLLDTDVLVVCEAHLLDVQSAAALLETVPDGARVVLCGDPDELQPAAPGRVFADLRDSGVVPVVTSAEQGPGVLGTLAAAVRTGSLPPVESPDRQVVLVGVRAAAEAVHRCVQLVGDSIPRALGIASDDIVVVTPAESGSTGATALNAALKQRLNPGPGQYAGFDIGDRVVRVPGPRTFAPAEGRVVEAVPDGLAVAFRDDPDHPETVPRDRLGELRHGWAVTVRQALGTRRAGVVAMLPGDAGALVTRALVYTAFTRARGHLSVVYPADGSLPKAVARETGDVRTTRLVAALREAADQMLGAAPESAEPGTD